jgi:ubiquinone/menaquinone biosynthesis C-methylase UbiE
MRPEIKAFYEKFGLCEENHPLGLIMQLRRIAVIKGLLKKIDKPKAFNLLIVGCGSQMDMLVLADDEVCAGRGIKAAFDLSYNSVKITRDKYKYNSYLVADAENLPFKSNRFNCIMCSEVLEHIPDKRKTVQDFYRVLNKAGHLIITVPNWISWYGLARKIAEWFFKKPVTSANQPIDEWYTYSKLKKDLNDKFNIGIKRGIWYFPPTGRGMRVIPGAITVPIYRLFEPVERLLEVLLPKCGHMLAVLCIKREKNG